MNDDKNTGQGEGFGSFAAKKMLVIVAAAAVVLAGLWAAIPYFETLDQEQSTAHESAVPQDVENRAMAVLVGPRRDVDDDEPVDALTVAQSKLHGHLTAQGMPEKTRGPDPEPARVAARPC